MSQTSTDLTEGFEYLPEEVINACIKSINYRYKLTKEDAMTITYEAYNELITLIEQQKFIFKNEQGFFAYLKRICLTKAKAHYNALKGNSSMVFGLDHFKAVEHEFEVELVNTKQQALQSKQDKYGINFNQLFEQYDSLSSEAIIYAFHQLDEKCKMILVLRSLKVKFKEIVTTLGWLYQIKNDNSCRNQADTCKKKLKKIAKSYQAKK